MRRGLVAVGAVLAVLGLVGLALGEIRWTEDRTTSLGIVEVTAEVEESREIPPLLAGVVLASGVGLLVWGASREG